MGGLRSLVARIEDLDVPFWILSGWFLVIISIRAGLEQIFFEKPFALTLYYHHAFFFLVTLAAGVIVLGLWARTDFIRTARVVAAGYVLLVLPPLVDHFVFHRAVRYAYASPQGFLKKALAFFWNEPGQGKGIFIEAVVIIAVAAAYTLLKTKSGRRSAGAAISLYAIFAVAGTPRLYLPLPAAGTPGFAGSRHIIYACIYLAIFLALVGVGLALSKKALLRSVLRDTASFRSVHFALMAAAGVFFNEEIRGRPFPGLLFGALAVLLSLLVWTVTVLWNNAHDIEIDRVSGRDRPLVLGWTTPDDYLGLGRALALLALFTSGLLGAKAFALVGLSLASAHAYSAPPLRLRLRLGSNVFIGWGSFLMFYLGLFAWTTIADWPLPPIPVRVSLAIFGALSLASLTKDAKDYEGDLRAGVRTVFTVYGADRGGRIAAVALALSLLTPLFIFHEAADILVFTLIAIASGAAFDRRRTMIVPLAGYVAAVAYGALRLFGLFAGRL